MTGQLNVCLHTAVAAVVFAASTIGGISTMPAAAQEGSGGSPREPSPPFRVIGNIHYVGSSNAGSFLITTPEGHLPHRHRILQNRVVGARQHSKLSYPRLADIKIILNTHAHADHVGGHAQLKE